MFDFATIPHFEQPSLNLGWIQIHAWGVLVAAGFLHGTSSAAKWAMRLGHNPVLVYDYALWAFVGGFGGAHIFHALFYATEETLANPLYLLHFWDGFSSFGGFFGAAVASVFFFRIRRKRFLDYCDPLSLGLIQGWAIGRLGCFLANDHPGIESDFFLAVENEWGVARHDLGLYDSLLSWAIFAILLGMAQKGPGRGAIGGALCLTYAMGRFALDNLRIQDARYFGLTPAQYSCFALGLFGMALLHISRSQGSISTHRDPDSPEGGNQ